MEKKKRKADTHIKTHLFEYVYGTKEKKNHWLQENVHVSLCMFCQRKKYILNTTLSIVWNMVIFISSPTVATYRKFCLLNKSHCFFNGWQWVYFVLWVRFKVTLFGSGSSIFDSFFLYSWTFDSAFLPTFFPFRFVNLNFFFIDLLVGAADRGVESLWFQVSIVRR